MDRTKQLRDVLAKLREIGADCGAEGRQLRRLAEECEALVVAVETAPEPGSPRKIG
jgi:UDP-N-acetylglucosamine enolpyruvyl transferase